jgi:hypothetical protein
VHEKGATKPVSGHFNLPAVHYTLSLEVSFGNCAVKRQKFYVGAGLAPGPCYFMNSFL